MKKRFNNKEDFLNYLFKIRPELVGLYDFSQSTDYITTNKPIRNIICLKHNISFSALPGQLLDSKKGCPRCKEEGKSRNIKIKTRQELIKRIESFGIDDYIVPDIDSYERIAGISVRLRCKVHGEYRVSYQKFMESYLNGWSPCKDCRDSQKKKDKAKIYFDRLNYIFSDYDFDFSWILNNYNLYQEKILVKCNKHNTEYWSFIGNLLKGAIPCQDCQCQSHGEEYVDFWLKNHKIDYKRWYRVDEVSGRHENSCVIIDFYIPSKNMWIECNGDQHYRYRSKFNRTLEGYNNQLRRDRNVREYCRTNGISLIEIPYTYYQKDKINYIMDQIFLKGKSFSDLGLKIPKIEQYPSGLGD